jgi:hypothetical protein
MNGAEPLDPETLVVLGLKLSVLVTLICVHIGQRKRAWTLRRDLDRLDQILAFIRRGPSIARRPVRPVRLATRRRRSSRR